MTTSCFDLIVRLASVSQYDCDRFHEDIDLDVTHVALAVLGQHSQLKKDSMYP